MFESNTSGMSTILPEELKSMIESQDVQLLDVREVREFSYCSIPGSINIPLALLPLRHQDLNRSRVTVVICHHGSRSYHGCRYLEQQGFQNVINLTGGIDGWARTVDPSVPLY